MSEDDLQRELNDHHRRVLLAAFRHIDGLLSDIEAAALSERPKSPLSRFAPDLRPEARQVVADYVARARARLEEALRALRIPAAGPRVSASKFVRSSLIAAEVALDQVSPSRLQGYGEIGSAGAAALGNLEADLARCLERLRTYLERGAEGNLSGRIRRLEKTALDLGLLRTLERIIAARGLVEYRETLEALLERLEAGTFEIAVFGRVNSGKSSLLNAVLGIDVLPVGVTPITAVPTRIAFGERPAARVTIADGDELPIDLERLEEFGSEKRNPGNEKRVVRISVFVPSETLRSGVVFVDTPGLGSLATGGARESYAYLPKCDLGIVLFDAAAAPSREDLEVLRLLYDSGIEAIAIVSRVDLLLPGDRERFREYVRSEISRALGLEIPVHLVSTVGGDRRLAEAWFAERLRPICERARELAQVAARRKLGHLREGVQAALRSALGREEAQRGDAEERRARVSALASEAESLIRRCARRCEAAAEELFGRARSLIAEAARMSSEARRETGPKASPTSILARNVAEETGSSCARVQEELLSLRDRLKVLLAAMGESSGLELVRPEELRLDFLSRPVFAIQWGADEDPGRRGGWLPRPIYELAARRKLEARFGRRLEGALAAFAAQLRDWAARAVRELTEQFDAQSEPLRAQAQLWWNMGKESLDREGLMADLREIEAAAGGGGDADLPSTSKVAEGNGSGSGALG